MATPETALQLRRRRDAALRLPPLDGAGVSDPLDRLRHNTIRVAHVYDGSRRALVRTNDLPELRRVLDGLGIVARWAAAPDRGIVVAKSAGPDIVAALEHFVGWRVVAHDGEPAR